jgi:hypothetical protein
MLVVTLRYNRDVRGETEVGRNAQQSVPPELPAALVTWARHAVHGCDLEIAWGQTRRDAVAHVVGVRPEPGFAAYNQAHARATARRVCQLLTDLQRPLGALLARGAHVADVVDFVSLAWDLERQAGAGVIPSSRARAREAAVIEEAARIAAKWSAALRRKTGWIYVELPDGRRRCTYAYTFASELLPWLAEALPALETRVGRRAHGRVMLAVCVLEELLRRRGVAHAPAREIAATVRAAWPELYRPLTPAADRVTADEAAAARKLLARARRTVSRQAVDHAMSCLPSWRPDATWRRRRVELVDGRGSLELLSPPNVPANVPATTRTRAKSGQRQPTTNRKTPR